MLPADLLLSRDTEEMRVAFVFCFGTLSSFLVKVSRCGRTTSGAEISFLIFSGRSEFDGVLGLLSATDDYCLINELDMLEKPCVLLYCVMYGLSLFFESTRSLCGFCPRCGRKRSRELSVNLT